MDVEEAAHDEDRSGPAPTGRRPTWVTGRVVVLLVALAAVGALAGVRVAHRLDRPGAGDRYQVAYEGQDACGNVYARADGLELEGQPDFTRPAVAAGRGTLVLDRVWELTENDGLGASGILTLADGTEIEVQGGTEGKYFSKMPCAIHG